MNRRDFLQLVLKEIHFKFDRKSIEKELNEHLDDSIADLMEEGYAREDAERMAIEQMGDPKEIGKMLNQEHHPILGYLYMASSVILAILSIPILYAVIFGGAMHIRTLTPVVTENSVESYPLDIDVNLSTHRLKLDNICLTEDGRYYITFRDWLKWEYSRADISSITFWVIDKTGYNSGASTISSGFGMNKGSIEFEWPEDGILYLKNCDGDTMEIELEEYCYE